MNIKLQGHVWVKKTSAVADIQMCLAIRYQVFVKGQNVPIEEEEDGLDAGCEHYLLFLNQLPVGTARVRYVKDSAKIERVSILEAYQKQGLGYTLMNAIIEDIKQNHPVSSAKLESQSHAIPFYEQFGFVVCSGEYLDAGIPHKNMRLRFKL
jgi:predicted GNAT family N-acyltransferase